MTGSLALLSSADVNSLTRLYIFLGQKSYFILHLMLTPPGSSQSTEHIIDFDTSLLNGQILSRLALILSVH